MVFYGVAYCLRYLDATSTLGYRMSNMTPAAYCEKKTKQSGSSFFYAFSLLPETKRRAMMALYAFCREVDDIADESDDADTAMDQLQDWQDEIGRVFHGTPEHPTGKELVWAGQHFHFTEELFLEMIDGMRMDVLHQPIIKPSDLALYCYRVAGVVGLLSIEVFGYSARNAEKFATTLGEALQLTNILRDLKEDAGRGRVYIPKEDCARFGVVEQDFIDGHLHPGMQSLLAHYGERAETCYRQALALLPDEDRVNLRPSLIMGAIYHAYLTHLKSNDFNVWTKPVRISSIRKLWIAWRVWRDEKKAAVRKTPVRLDF